MKEQYKKILLLGIVLAIAVFFRLYHLSRVPPSASLDEATIGWNAYSIMKTGRDEYGQIFPIVLRAYDDWRPALYVYTVIPVIWFFGLSVFAVRLPSVLFSLGSIIGVYSVCESLFFHQGKKNKEYSPYLPPAVCFLMAISPWDIYLSRLGHEVNIGFFLVTMGFAFFLLGVYQNKLRFMALSAISFGLSVLSYQSEKIIVPVVVVGLFVVFYKYFLHAKRSGVVFLTIFFCFCLYMIHITWTPEGMARFSGTSAIYPDHPLYKEYLMHFTDAKRNKNILGELFYNRRFVPVVIITSNYISHFQPIWLFTGTVRENHKVPYMGLLYLWEIIPICIGVFSLAKNNNKQISGVILVWLLTGPIAAAITTQSPHALRAFTMMPAFTIISGVGIVGLLSYTKNSSARYIVGISFVTICIFSCYQLSKEYFITFPKTQSDSFELALQEALKYVGKNHDTFDSVIVTNEHNGYQSYMFYLFYNQIDPEWYTMIGGTKSGGFAETHKIGNIQFRPIHWEQDKNFKNTLLIANTQDVPIGISDTRFKLLDNSDALVSISL